MSECITQIRILGTDYRCWVAVGSAKGCFEEATSLKKLDKNWTMMGPGEWQSDHVLIEVFKYSPLYSDPDVKWDREDFIKKLKECKKTVSK